MFGHDVREMQIPSGTRQAITEDDMLCSKCQGTGAEEKGDICGKCGGSGEIIRDDMDKCNKCLQSIRSDICALIHQHSDDYWSDAIEAAIAAIDKHIDNRPDHTGEE